MKPTPEQTAAQNRVHDLLAELAPPFIKFMTAVMKSLQAFVQWLMTDVPNFFIDGTNSVIELLNTIIYWASFTAAGRETIGYLDRIERNTREKQETQSNVWLQQFLGMTNPGTDALLGAPEQKDQRLRQPLMEGL